MQALILAGGKGTRLRPLTVYTPKPIVPVVNRPFLLYQIDILKKAGITDITLSLSYQPDKIEQILGNGSDFGVNLRYITEPSPMGPIWRPVLPSLLYLTAMRFPRIPR